MPSIDVAAWTVFADLKQRCADAGVRPVPILSRPDRTSAFANATGFRVEVLVSNRGSDELTGAPLPMPALGGVSAQPPRNLDVLIEDPIRSTQLHAGGISVTVPAPERFAIHELIVANERPERTNQAKDEKRAKDLAQAGFLIDSPARSQSPLPWRPPGSRRGTEVRPWRRRLETGSARLDEAGRMAIARAVGAHGGTSGYEPTQVGYLTFPPQRPAPTRLGAYRISQVPV